MGVSPEIFPNYASYCFPSVRYTKRLNILKSKNRDHLFDKKKIKKRIIFLFFLHIYVKKKLKN